MRRSESDYHIVNHHLFFRMFRIRQSLLVLLSAVATVSVTAMPISLRQAQQRAREFMIQQGDHTSLTPVNAARMTGSTRRSVAPLDSQVQPYYVFDRGSQGQGFVIVSGDDELVPVLGYCQQGTFSYDHLPPAMQEWLDVCARQIERVQQGAPVVRAVPTHPAIGQLMDCTWSQGAPYNNECPMYFSLGRSVTGCVATAYAQILYYHRSKMVTETQADMPAYDTWTIHPTYGQLHVEGIPQGSPIDWDNMLPDYGGSSNARQKLAVAQLMHYCGVAVQMDYTNEASGAQSYEVYSALRHYFGFGSSVRYVTYESVTSDEEWDAIVYNELAQGRPVYISGSNTESGHAFVCDGYDGQRQYHINWGWGGMSDGYYYLSNLTPGQQGIGGSDDGYNAYREVIVGIEPENYAERAMSFTDATARRLCTEAWDQNGDGVLSYGEAAQVTSIGTVLKGSAVKNFTELHYFTGLTTIDDDAFSDCRQLVTVQLPRQLTSIGARAFKGCVKLENPTLPEGLTTIGQEAFSGCRALTVPLLPQGLRSIGPKAFLGCSQLLEVTLPTSVASIGDEAFAQCPMLSSFTVKTMRPQAMTMGDGVFSGSAVGTCMLTIMQGTRSYFEQHSQWQQFGTLNEVRELSRGQFIPLTVGTQVLLHHVGSGRYLTKGEAWGTQAVVGEGTPMRFEVRHPSTLPEGVYCLYSVDTGNDRHYLFRTTADNSVGVGVQAAFVDGNLDQRAHWAITPVDDDTYTISIPAGYADYAAGHCWGVQTSHLSGVASPTWGVYSDVPYEGHEQDCQWRFVRYDATQMANFEAAKTLGSLLATAVARHINVSHEQQVYQNLESTTDELLAAQSTVRKKLHFIEFANATVRETCISLFDVDADGELSQTEAAQVVSLGESRFQNTSITSFDELQHFTNLAAIYGNTFANCRQLQSVVLPASVERIYYRAFMNCTKLTSIILPEYLNSLGDNAFTGCTSLQTVTVNCPDPTAISLGSNVFSGVTLSNVTLQVPAGTKALYEQAPVWRDFGTIREVRGHTMPVFSPIREGVSGYIYNMYTRKFISKGEAYGTQAVVSRKGMVYEWRRSASMPQGQYYLYSAQTGMDGKVLFRTSSDTKVGSGVKACFVDGTADASAYWQVDSVAPGVYTLQVPATHSDYTEGEYLGTDPAHQNDAYSPTDGIYWDVAMGGDARRCQWAFITLADMEAAAEADAAAEKLRTLLQRAAEQHVDAQAEQAVYDDLGSTPEQIAQAVASLREKLHYITFADSRAATLCIANWDEDQDGELTYEEAAMVTSLGQVFRNQSTLQSLQELRFFTGLKEISDDAFRNSSSLTTIYLPENVASLGQYAFGGCNALKYVVVLNSATVLPKGMSSMPSAVTLFVPETLVDAYQADEGWSRNFVTPFTGTPVVTALPATRIYGRSIASLKYQLTGAPVDGEPQLSCDEVAVATTPVGDYAIHIEPGTITTPGLVCRQGVFTVTPAQLTVTARSYARKQGEPNPTFEVDYKGFRNRETEDVLLVKPVATCTATPDSPAGEYEISVSGAQAQNYTFTYVSGVLTVQQSDGIATMTGNAEPAVLFDLQGRRLADRQVKKGIYVTRDGKKVVLGR